jgi:hypothetical protein
LLTSLLKEPVKLDLLSDPPYAVKEAVEGEKAIQLSQTALMFVVEPKRILIVRVVP